MAEGRICSLCKRLVTKIHDLKRYPALSKVCAENRWGRSAWAQDELEDSNKVSALLHNELAEALHLKDGQKSRRHIMQPLRRAKFGAYPVRVRGYACGAAHLLTILQPMGSSLLGTLPTS
eukprot:TRINITY_DN25953_c1_g1_i2.p1 TRINITY_DN25953_c1_g1~~TRINITY_DN25953_c1_g1_i2.p1  ORF type:complete len:120 (-),score=17.74 TRINITY_DN25953_c1_g1_i2:337-696(-)